MPRITKTKATTAFHVKNTTEILRGITRDPGIGTIEIAGIAATNTVGITVGIAAETAVQATRTTNDLENHGTTPTTASKGAAATAVLGFPDQKQSINQLFFFGATMKKSTSCSFSALL